MARIREICQGTCDLAWGEVFRFLSDVPSKFFYDALFSDFRSGAGHWGLQVTCFSSAFLVPSHPPFTKKASGEFVTPFHPLRDESG